MNLSDFGRDYLLLGLRINKAIEDEVDRKYLEAYFDPDDLQRLVINEKSISPTKLLDTCQNLQEDLNNQGFEKERVNFLERIYILLHGRISNGMRYFFEHFKDFSYMFVSICHR